MAPKPTNRQPKPHTDATTQGGVLFSREWLEKRQPVHPLDNIRCQHCDSADVRLIWKWSYEVIDHRASPPRKWVEGEFKCGCMACFRETKVVRTVTWNKKRLSQLTRNFWHTVTPE